MAELQSPQHPLEVLPAMLNLMLVQTGKFFKEAASGNSDDLVSARDVLTEVGNSANRRFHEALDELEIEFTKAKAVFERDLRKERAKRAERERAAGILTRPAGVTKSRSPGAATKKSPPSTSIGGKGVNVMAQNDATSSEVQDNDQVTTNGINAPEEIEPQQEAHRIDQPEGLASNITNGSSAKPPLDPSPDLSKSEVALVDGQSEQVAEKTEEKTAGKATEKVPNKSPEKADPSATSIPQMSEPPLIDSAPTTHDPAPFESMFNDLSPTQNGTNLDFDLGFSTTDDLLDFENIDMTNTVETANLNANQAEDINTLLPGLENYVNDSSDFSMIDLPMEPLPGETAAAAPVNGVTDGGIGGVTGVGEGRHVVETAPMESNFDDLFGSAGDWSGDGDLGDGAMVDFDEDWFKTDG